MALCKSSEKQAMRNLQEGILSSIYQQTIVKFRLTQHCDAATDLGLTSSPAVTFNRGLKQNNLKNDEETTFRCGGSGLF